jgi:hypothetical protein
VSIANRKKAGRRKDEDLHINRIVTHHTAYSLPRYLDQPSPVNESQRLLTSLTKINGDGMIQGIYSSRRSSLYVSMAGIIGQNKTPPGNMVSRCVEYPVIESPLPSFSPR